MTSVPSLSPSNLESFSDLRRFVDVLFPFEFDSSERAMLLYFWKNEYPGAMPVGHPSGGHAVVDQSDLVKIVWEQRLRRNLAVAFATFHADSSGRFRRVKANFVRSQALGIDMDCGRGKEFKNPDQAHARLESFERETGIAPGLVVASGTGLQAYVLLDRPCDNPLRFQEALRRLSLAFGGDPGARDISRVLRPPATQNFKYSPPLPVRLLEAGGKRYSMRKVLTALPVETLKPNSRRASSLPVTNLPRIANSGRVRPVPSDVQELLNGAMPETCRGNKSSRDWRVARRLVELGFTPADALATMRASSLGRDVPRRKTDPDYYLKRTVARAFASHPLDRSA